MSANDLGRKLGIGVRVAGRIAKQRAEQASAATAQPNQQSPTADRPIARPNIKEVATRSHNLTRAAGRGVGGFLRPFGRVGGILWLEVTGFFFGLFALYFAQDLYRIRQSYLSGPNHAHFLLSAVACVVFLYLSVSAFWRAGKK